MAKKGNRPGRKALHKRILELERQVKNEAAFAGAVKSAADIRLREVTAQFEKRLREERRTAKSITDALREVQIWPHRQVWLRCAPRAWKTITNTCYPLRETPGAQRGHLRCH